MVVNLRAKKRLVSRVVGVGLDRIKFDTERSDDIADAITRENIRSLITAGTITIKPAKGTSRGRSKFKKSQKSKRGATTGSKKGRKGARVGKKEVYVKRTRALRYRLKVAKDRKDITNPEFWELYRKVGGNTVKDTAHLRGLIEEIKARRKD
ncbi:50S ribosomal protein L19e [Candidatus Nitrosotenuis chungbukensis]|uniref:50S ribosomal protein L19e n=1 Tax=Candidatus Nitrosotenuis chungbukensis TaxID=1353246 RepID=UPI0005B26843|nr:50S ribosomal protein L19e [Candidatus Nitrosotenuis chungbukensis]WKT58831.1 50S ribosomal protein L19e [Candidatus Nitrosotenuis chungbukensis]